MKWIWIGLFCCPLCLFAQVDSTRQPNVRQHELALNFTFFVKQFIDFGGNTLAVSPYALSYKYISANNHSLRAGMGAGLATTNQEADDPNGIDRKSKDVEMDFRVGYEYRVKLAKAWSMFAGIDGTFHMDKESSTTSSQFQIVDVERKNTQFGGGPVLGVQVHFNDRVSLFTESSLYFTVGTNNNVNEFKNPNFPDANFKEATTVKSTGLDFALPTSLYFAVRLFKK